MTEGPIPRVGLRPGESGAAIGRSRSFIYKAVAAGKLVAYSSGRGLIIRPSDLDRFVTALARKGKQEPGSGR
jgi:excisionase family DNA binding protein